MSTRTQTTSDKPAKGHRTVLGRSEATGRLVLKPASKSGAISLRDARTALSNVRDGKKK